MKNFKDLEEFSKALEQITNAHDTTTTTFEKKHAKLTEVNIDLENQILALFAEKIFMQIVQNSKMHSKIVLFFTVEKKTLQKLLRGDLSSLF